MQYKNKLVSVIIPTYKRSDLLLECLQSVLCQTYKNIEIILVNDNEKNDEYSKKLYGIVQTINDKRFVFIEQEHHTNGARARNYGLKYSHGEYVCFLDDDEFFEENKIEEQVKAFEELDDSWGAVTCLKTYYRNGVLYRASLPFKDGYIFKDIIYSTIVLSTAAPLIKRKALDETGYFDEELKRMQDIQLFSFFASKYKIKLIKKHLLKIETSDATNRPSVEKSLGNRDAFITSVNSLFGGSNFFKMKTIKHLNFRIGVNFLKSHHFFRGLFMILKSSLLPSVFFKEFYYYYVKIKETKKKDRILKKYGVS